MLLLLNFVCSLQCGLQKQHHTSVGGHLLLCNQHLLRTVDDKVAAGIKRTLVQLREITVRQGIQQTVRRPQHYRDLADESLLVLRLDRRLSLADNSLGYVDIQRC